MVAAGQVKFTLRDTKAIKFKQVMGQTAKRGTCAPELHKVKQECTTKVCSVRQVECSPEVCSVRLECTSGKQEYGVSTITF